MNILVLNAGSSSLKYQLIDVDTKRVIARGLCERVGNEGANHIHCVDSEEVVISTPMRNHSEALQVVLDHICDPKQHILNSLDEIDAIGHRVVQGGKYFSQSMRITPDVITKISQLAELAPLHNKAALMGIEACQSLLPSKPQVAVFDTAFFHNLAPTYYTYPLPFELAQKYDIRRYGAHGTSHRYIAQRAANFLHKNVWDLNLITCHLGNGASITAIKHGKALDTSMGLTPLEGLMMGTRCGSIDPAIVTYLMERENLSPQEMNDILNKQSGLLGVSGVSNDLRSVYEAAEQGNDRAKLAYEMFAVSIKRYVGQYIALLGGVDAIVLSGGVGENCPIMRRLVFSDLQSLGIQLDETRNQEKTRERAISSDASRVHILVIPTNEELMIALDTQNIVSECV